MSNADRILQMANEKNGIVTSAEVTNAGISRGHFKILVDKGLLERVERGVYIIPTVFEDEMFNLQTKFKRGIFSHETALFIHNLTDRTPIKFSMTFPVGYNTKTLQKTKMKYSRVNKDYFHIGVVWAKSPAGNPIRVYNAERTLCDILKARSHTDIQIVTDAFKQYTRRHHKDIPLLSEYGKLFHVETKLQSYLEVLL